jgi:hypothetical protein
MFTIQLVGLIKDGHKVLASKDLHLLTLKDAQVWARHEFDIELHLSKYMVPPALKAVMVQVLEDGHVIWKLTEAERAHEVQSRVSRSGAS